MEKCINRRALNTLMRHMAQGGCLSLSLATPTCVVGSASEAHEEFQCKFSVE